MEFKSGAVRSDDAKDVDFYLISPISLNSFTEFISTNYEELCNFKDTKIEEHISFSIECIFAHLDGYRSYKNLHYSLFHLLTAIDKLNNHSVKYTESILNNRYDLIPPFGLISIAKAYAEGAKKYSPYNCEKGIPVHDLLNHALRHFYFGYLSGDVTEDHLGHAAWNILMAIHSDISWPGLNENHLRPIKD